jgi:hypothetical protein
MSSLPQKIGEQKSPIDTQLTTVEFAVKELHGTVDRLMQHMSPVLQPAAAPTTEAGKSIEPVPAPRSETTTRLREICNLVDGARLRIEDAIDRSDV